ncbi:hypothetical protein [Nodosilinea sp. LEGE 06152]|uniref:hypothetical protein n=1 Tax=Nodosilinea sp. LEGE 06152 TaxID=2777966 RepID=UPI001D14CDF7|nr:hypothetical protein [Nodosilinea sp. LEGE 06152]
MPPPFQSPHPAARLPGYTEYPHRPRPYKTPLWPPWSNTLPAAWHLSEAELRTIQDFVDCLIWKHYGEAGQSLVKRSAEARAIDRIPALDDPTQWVTVIEEGEEVDEDALNPWLEARGYQD